MKRFTDLNAWNLEFQGYEILKIKRAKVTTTKHLGVFRELEKRHMRKHEPGKFYLMEERD